MDDIENAEAEQRLQATSDEIARLKPLHKMLKEVALA